MLCAHTAGRLCSRKFGIINVWIRVLKWPRLFDFSSSASSSVVMGSGGGGCERVVIVLFFLC